MADGVLAPASEPAWSWLGVVCRIGSQHSAAGNVMKRRDMHTLKKIGKDLRKDCLASKHPVLEITMTPTQEHRLCLSGWLRRCVCQQVSIRWGNARVFFAPSSNYVDPELHPEEYVNVDANGAIMRGRSL
jgi:hypothetical protein